MSDVLVAVDDVRDARNHMEALMSKQTVRPGREAESARL